MTILEIKGQEYPLRLTTKQTVQLEERLGKSPIMLIMDILEDKMPKMKDIVITLHGMLQESNHGITMDKAYELMDAYLEEHSMFDILPQFVEVFKECGLLKEAGTESPNK